MGRNYYAVQLASAEILAGQAAEMIADAAGILKDAEEDEGEKELGCLSDKVGIAIEKIRRKRLDAEAFASETDDQPAPSCLPAEATPES